MEDFFFINDEKVVITYLKVITSFSEEMKEGPLFSMVNHISTDERLGLYLSHIMRKKPFCGERKEF